MTHQTGATADDASPYEMRYPEKRPNVPYIASPCSIAASRSLGVGTPEPGSVGSGRLLLKRPGYDLDMARVIEQARKNGCFFEINSSPDRLDLSAENVRAAAQAGVKIAVSTDAHSTWEFGLIRYGLDQARRAGLTRGDLLNCLPWSKLSRLMKR